MAKEIYIGNMDRRISVIMKVATKGTTGAEVFVNTTVATVWAYRKSASSDKELDDKVVALNVFEYLVRWHEAIAAENIQALFIDDDGVEYEIYGVEEVGRKQFLRLKCERRE